MWCQVEREREAKGHWDTRPESEEAILEVDPLVLPAPADTTVDQRHTSSQNSSKSSCTKLCAKTLATQAGWFALLQLITRTLFNWVVWKSKQSKIYEAPHIL